MTDKTADLGICNICGSSSFVKMADKIREGGSYKIYKCNVCSHVQLLPRPNLDEDKAFYDKDQQEKFVRKNIDIENLRITFYPDIKRRVDFITQKFKKGSSLLDIGCGYGFFPEEMKKAGFSVQGIEVSKERREYAKEVTDVEVLDVNLADPEYSMKPIPQNLTPELDIVTMFHVLEHMADPIAFAKNIRSLLKEGGCFVVEVPNVDELMLETCTAYNAFYWTRPHLNYFSAKTLKTVLEKAGFKRIKIDYVQRYGVENLYNWLSIGKPQLEKPVLQTTAKQYQWLDEYYGQKLAEMGKTDALFALAYIE